MIRPTMRCTRGAIFAAVSVAIVWIGDATPAGASWTAPPLALSQVESRLGNSGILVRLTGNFPSSDLVADEYPLQVFIRELGTGSRFVCLSVPWGPMEGTVPEHIEDNGFPEHEDLSSKLIDSLLGTASPLEGARILHLGPDRIDVLLPREFPSGPAEAVLFVMYQESPVLSNAVEFEIGPNVENEPGDAE